MTDVSNVRTVLVHLNVSVLNDNDSRTTEEIAGAILDALEVGGDDDSVRGLTIECPLAEEV